MANTNAWAKAGVMIRETLDADSKHAMVVVSPTSGVSFQRRTETALDSNETTQTGLQAPYWVKITRIGNTFTAQCSADNVTWTSVGTDPAASSATITMASDVYIGLAVSSHTTDVLCGARFSSVSAQGTVTGEWQTVDVGVGQPTGNAPDTLYVVLEDSAGHRSVVSHPDQVMIATGAWEEWAIPMSRFTSGQVDANKIKKMTLSIGDQSASKAGGTGRLIIDDVRVTRVGP